ncbi:MAG: CD0415/CD1112 family protein [Lachnospiraceae bacterium]|nr:CD0415/CD1112 family protein [Lachnospiraceae bacterium]
MSSIILTSVFTSINSGHIIKFGIEDVWDVVTGNVSGSEFIGGLLDAVWRSMYHGLYKLTRIVFGNIQNVLNDGILRSRNIINSTPKEWNETAFSFIKGVAENAAIPIAGCIITFIFCWQLISMVQEGNQMHNIKPETIILLLMKLVICLLVCAKSFEIVCGLFDLGHWATEQITFVEIDNPDGDGKIDFNIVLDENPEECGFGEVMAMLVNLIMTVVAEGIVYVLNVVMIINVSMWYLELLIYASAAPIPFSTFINKEWGQVGLNYLRKMLAMSFQGFFMIVAFGIYEAMVINIIGSAGNAPDQYMMSIVTTCGCGFGLAMILNKSGSIASSIFNAH